MTTRGDVEELLARQAALLARLDGLGGSAGEVLAVGNEVLRFAEEEERAFFPLLPLLDPIARAELTREHDEIGEDLKLLEWLLATTPESPDVEILVAVLVRKIRNHVERDGRLLLRASRLTLS
jgi:hemerythrin HHE cation binding domain-containing protein